MKGEALWIAGIGYSVVTTFFLLEKWWSYFIFGGVFAFSLWIYKICPRELKIVYYMFFTLFYMIIYYLIKPNESGLLF